MKKPKSNVIVLPSRKPRPGEVVNPPQHRNDGWTNFVTSMGTNQDKRTYSQLTWDNRPPEFYEQLYAGGGIPARIVDLIPEEAMREWVDWTGVDVKRKEAVDRRCEELDVRGAFIRAWKWGRAFGGGLLHIVTDTSDPASPLEPGEKVIGLRDLSRWDVRILTTDVEYDFGSPNFGHPRIYYLNVQMGSQYKGYPIHWTRMIRFDGQLVPRRTFIRNGYWHDSILNRIYNSIRNYETSNDNAASALQDFNVDIYKLKNVAAMMGAGQEDVLRSRIEMMAFTKSIINAMILDTDLEDYENKGRSLEGVAELLVHQANRLVAETDIPHTKLLGESPDGSNATGNSTTQQWYNHLGAEQKNYAKPKLMRLKEIIFPDEEELGFKFRSLHILNDTETADLRLKVAQTDAIYESMGALDATEITDSRFGGDEYSMETELDEEAREAGLITSGSNNDLGEGNGEDGDGTGNDSGVQGSEEKAPPGEEDDSKGAKPVASGSKGSDKDKNGKGADRGSDNGSGNQKRAKPDDADAKPSKSVKDKKNDAFPTTGDQPPEGWSNKKEPGPSDITEINNKKVSGKGNDITGRKRADGKKTSEASEVGFEAGKGESEFEFRNQTLDVPGGKKATQSFISQTMSEPMRDPKTDPQIKGPGIPNKARTILPTRGTGVTAPSGSAPEDSGKVGSPREMTQIETNKVEDSDKIDAVVEKHTASKVISPGRAATIIVRKGDKFLMGKRKDNGRWSLPGGHVESGESHHQGAVRELMEETGILAKKLKFLGGRIVEPQMGQSVHVNMYEHHHDEESRPTNKLDPDKEFNSFKWFSSKEKLPEDIVGNLHHPNNIALQHIGVL